MQKPPAWSYFFQYPKMVHIPQDTFFIKKQQMEKGYSKSYLKE